MGIGKRQVKVRKTNGWDLISWTNNFLGFIAKSKSSIERKSAKGKALAPTNSRKVKASQEQIFPSQKVKGVKVANQINSVWMTERNI